eukprot:TRINITY_DN22696_c0_g2_i2.p1 TRINITY_DN22696_c0_g2~~TRINITY_DN22696_c0_g2_i2.p1  ORF type:complete len:746 (-),score=142.71 TRINITY_DN22696_c0_g2_i2:64-2301(-)
MHLDFNDEEILAYFITLLKSLAMRLDQTTIKFFFIQHPDQSFPLYTEATKFFSHRDQMVRAAVRTITLQVYRIDDPGMRRFVHRHASESYFSQLAYHLRDLWLRMNAALTNVVDGDLSNVRHENELQQDLLIYISDVFDLEVAELNDVLADRLLNCAILPVLLSSLSSSKMASRAQQGQDANSRFLMPVVALFLLRQVLDTLRCRLLLKPIFTALLQPLVPLALAYYLPEARRAMSPARDSRSNQDHMSNTLRGDFLAMLYGEDDGQLLFSASVLHSCVRGRWALPPDFMQEAGVLPSAVDSSTTSNASTTAPASNGGGTSSSSISGTTSLAAASAASSFRKLSGKMSLPSAAQRSAKNPTPPEPVAVSSEPKQEKQEKLEVLPLLLKGFEHQASWRLDTCQTLCRIVLDLFLEPVLAQNMQLHAAALRALHGAMCQAAKRALAVMRGNTDEAILDTFLDEWEFHKRPTVTVTEVAGQIRRVLLALPASAATAASSRSGRRRVSASAEAAKAFRVVARNLLVLRRTLASLVRYGAALRRESRDGTPTVRGEGHSRSPHAEPWNGSSEEQAPFQQDEGSERERLREGAAFEVGHMDRIVCGVAAAGGSKHTRYLLLHNSYLLLAQPDLSSPGWLVVRTLWPLSRVQSLVDRGDPRTLRLGLSARRGSPGPGEAIAAFRQQAPLEVAEDDCQGAYYTLTLNFEDVRRCHAANLHLQDCRKDLRGKLNQSVLEFVERCSNQAPPELSL